MYNAKLISKPVKYHGITYHGYEVDESGNIYSFKSNKSLTPTDPSRDTCQYPRVTLSDGFGYGKKVLIHRVVAEAFVPLNKPCETISEEEWKECPESIKTFIMKNMNVNHIDHNKNNYHASNLEWVTAEENADKRETFYRNLRLEEMEKENA